jgi:hypothetical protein
MGQETPSPRRPWWSLFGSKSTAEQGVGEKSSSSRWTMGILEDKETIEVPGAWRNGHLLVLLNS